MTTEDALRALGVQDDTLAQEEVDFLDENGYLVLHNIITRSQLEAFIARLQELSESEGAQLEREAVAEEGMIKLFDLVNKGAIFDLCFTSGTLASRAGSGAGMQQPSARPTITWRKVSHSFQLLTTVGCCAPVAISTPCPFILSYLCLRKFRSNWANSNSGQRSFS